CVSTALIADVFAIGDAPAAAWSEYDEAFGDEPVYLFAASRGDVTLDLALISATGRNTLVRDDVQENADAAYRAAAVANTPGAVAVMTWGEAQDALESNEGLQLVSV